MKLNLWGCVLLTGLCVSSTGCTTFLDWWRGDHKASAKTTAEVKAQHTPQMYTYNSDHDAFSYEPFNGHVNEIMGKWWMERSSGSWELIIFPSGIYSLQIRDGSRTVDAEVGTWKLWGSRLKLKSDGRLDEEREHYWTPRDMDVYSGDQRVIMVPKRYDETFEHRGATRFTSFMREDMRVTE